MRRRAGVLQDELADMMRWFDGGADWYGLEPLQPDQRIASSSPIPAVNAILTSHELRPVYLERLRLDRDQFQGARVLEVGSGPLAPILAFAGCVRHGLDPLNDRYVAAGWPLYALDVVFTNAYGERMPYPDGHFDAAISCNTLDHVDDFDQVAAEMRRVVRPGGGLYFEVEYHAPTTTEPLELSDATVRRAFSGVTLTKVCERTKAEAFAATGVVSSTASANELVLWHGRR